MRTVRNSKQLVALAMQHGRPPDGGGPRYIRGTKNDGDGSSFQNCSVQAFARMLETYKPTRNKAQVLHLYACMPPCVVNDHTTIAIQLIAMLVEVGSIYHARHVFDRLRHRDAPTWSFLITAYVRHGELKLALTLHQIMRTDTSLHPSDYAFVALLKACIGLKDMETGIELHSLISNRGLLKANIYVGSALIDMYIKCGSLSKAQEVFYELENRDVVLWTTLIAGYVDHDRGEEALQCVKQMKKEGFSPNAHTLVCSSKACGSLKATYRGQEIHTEITMKGYEREIMVGNSLLSMYATCGSLEIARFLLDKLPFRDVVSWTAMIDGYAEHGYGEEALNCLEGMQHESIAPNALTYTCCVKACCSMGAIEKGYELHSAIIEKGFESDLPIGSILVTMYVKAGALTEAQFVFDRLTIRDYVLWTALIEGYSQVGESGNVFSNFDKMLGEGIKPELVSFLIIINVCNHEGLVEKGLAYFEAIRREYGLTPTLGHFTAIIDLLGRSGHLSKAISMIREMPWHPDYVLWCTVLMACRKWGDSKIASYAFEHAIKLNEKGMTAYVCMSNIYADAAMHDEANKVKALWVQEQGLEEQVLG